MGFPGRSAAECFGHGEPGNGSARTPALFHCCAAAGGSIQWRASPPEWTALFAAAGLDPARFTPTEPKWTSLAAFDARAAWTGAYPEQPEIPLRIEAAAYRGKPVYFQLLEPWNKPWRTQANQPNKEDRVFLVAFCLFLAILLGAVLLARYNIRQGRGDRRGAFRLAFFVFAVSILKWLFGASHVPTIAEVFIFLFLAV